MPAPFPARMLDAVGACTRALAESPDADALLARADAATLGGLRACGDRLALRERFHQHAIHQRHRPADARAAELFDALEQARLDVLGALWLPGVARNLLNHPGAEDDAVRWLAFEALAGTRSPALPVEKAGLVNVVRRHLPQPLVARLALLGGQLRDQEQFASGAAAWVREAAPHVPATASPGRQFQLPPRPSGNDIRRGRYARPGAPRSAEQIEERTEGGGAGTNRRDSVQPGDGYRVFTTAHDRVVNAAALATREELAELRVKLQDDLSAIRPVVARLAKRLLRVLMAHQAREWRFDQDEGLLDASRLAPLVASRGGTRPFKQESESPFPSTVVTLLIDHSGSMRGRPMQIAALTVEIFARVLERCGVKCEVLGFTTRDWDGGEPAREWAAQGYPDQPGRLNALEHIVIKDADVPWRRARVALGLFLRDEMLKENIDGEAVSWAHRRLLARSERRRILVVVSDGTPMDEATFAANGFDYLDAHLLSVVQEIEQRSPVHLAAIGIGHDVSRFYRNATKIARIDDLGPALGDKLMVLLASGKPG